MKKILLMSVMMFFWIGISAQVTDTIGFQNQGDELELPTILLMDADFDESSTSGNDYSTLLQSSRDVFNSIAAYNFGSLRFRIRGYDSKYGDVMINGVLMNDPESGRPIYSNWGGLNDAVRNTTITEGLGLAYSGFGGVGGLTNISTRASNYRRQMSISYAHSNRSYNNRIMASVGTGMMPNGWAFFASASERWSREGYVEGTFYQAYSYLLSAEKRLNAKHSLNFTVFAAPSLRGGTSPVVQECYDLVGSNYYNPNWGYQTAADGSLLKRNARVSNYNQPMFQLSYYWTPNVKTSLTATAYYWFGRGGQTSLDWGEAADPRPDYYRNLPSYYLTNANSTAEYQAQYQAWLDGDASVTQINWDDLYAANVNHLATIDDANGVAGNSITGRSSKYILAERRNDKQQAGASLSFKHSFRPFLHLDGGLSFAYTNTHCYKTIDDLLGGDFYLDVNKYADNLESDEYQVNLLNTNHVAELGDVFGYDYFAHNNHANIWAQLNYHLGRFDTYVAAEGTFTEIWRTGNYLNGAFPDNSYGDAPKNYFLAPGVKGGANFAIDGRNYITANVGFMLKAPQFRDIYISPRTRNSIVSNAKSEQIFAADLSYQYRSPIFRARLTAYYAHFANQIWNRSFYCENVFTGADATGNNYTSSFINFIMTDIKTQSYGLEFGAEYNVSPTVSLQAAGAIGECLYANRPSFSVYNDNNAEEYIANEKVYLENYHVGAGPQTVASLGVKYNSPKYWWAGLNANYFDHMYFDVNPYNHTEFGLSQYAQGDIRIEKALAQNKMNPAFTLDFFGGISKRYRGYTFALNLSINNLTNNKNHVLYGYEQLRYNANDPDMFPAKYSYMYGLNYFVSLTIRK